MNKEYPSVSIIILNLNGKHIIHHCLDSLRKVNYPKDKTEIIVVDNGSKDGSADFVKSNYPEVILLKNNENLGFSAPNNAAAKKAKGEYLVFVNNDMRVEKNWLSRLVEGITTKEGAATCSSKILSWDGNTIDHGGSDSDVFMNARLDGYRKESKSNSFNQFKEILFPSGGSMIVEKELFLEVGGFDDDFFAFYEDVDLGIRLKILGYKSYFVPDSVAYHMHSATAKKIPIEKLRVLQLRNILWVILKNYSAENLGKYFAPAMLLSLKRTFDDCGGFELQKYDFWKINSPKKKKIPLHLMNKNEFLLFSDLIGYNDILLKWDKFMGKRKWIQKRRKCGDEEIFSMMKSRFIPIVENPEYKKLYNSFLELFGIEKKTDEK